jgi:hypothetical protein
MSVGQRIVGFAEADQILASATFHAAVSKLDPDYAQLFDFAGARTDAQLREHALYALNQRPTPVRSPQPRAPMPASALGRRASRAAVIPVLLRRPRLATALAVALILLTAVALRQAVQRSDALPPTPVAARPEAVAEPTPPISSAAPAARLREASAATGTVRLTIVPWGEIYVDGEKVGVTPPLRELALKPGPHRIEIRNPGVASHVQAVHVSAGEEIRIRHRFD